jgi:pimeloyl-ACP methyl ester carboxylesterase
MTVWYEEHGAGPPLLLLHGWQGTGESWAPCVPHLAGRFRLIIPDLRGHGRTDNPGLALISPRSAARDALAFAAALGLAQAHWAGHSFGGHALLWGALDQPSRFLSLTTVATPYALPEQTRRTMARAGGSPTPASIEKSTERHPALGPEGWRWFAAEAIRQAEMHADSDIDPGALGSLSCPYLVVNSDDDDFTPVEQALTLYRSAGRGRLLVLPAGGHWVHRTYPDQVAAAIARNALQP